jgi:hypothetical protein
MGRAPIARAPAAAVAAAAPRRRSRGSGLDELAPRWPGLPHLEAGAALDRRLAAVRRTAPASPASSRACTRRSPASGATEIDALRAEALRRIARLERRTQRAGPR